ncbi:hypothetical protein MycrhDRAFT_5515 [Mycolicibacterium rhodesiae JS60]|nr:hypothetical protein MycrhDRAFT_5515 [Mycolicibacterium rhodesiae JS60]
MDFLSASRDLGQHVLPRGRVDARGELDHQARGIGFGEWTPAPDLTAAPPCAQQMAFLW